MSDAIRRAISDLQSELDNLEAQRNAIDDQIEAVETAINVLEDI